MMKHAVDIGLRGDDPTRDVRALRPKSKLGFHRWTEDEIAQFEARHPIGTKARLALALGIYKGKLGKMSLPWGHSTSATEC
jgi:hypothetical protein